MVDFTQWVNYSVFKVRELPLVELTRKAIMRNNSIELQEEIKGLNLKQAILRLEETKSEFKKLNNAWRGCRDEMPQNHQDRYMILRRERGLLVDQVYKLRMTP